MSRIDLLPGLPTRAPVAHARMPELRKRMPLTKRELDSVFKRVMDRLLKQGSAGPFAVFVIRRGRGRVFQLIGIKSPDLEVQMRRNRVLQHWIGTYDGKADPNAIWEDLCSFDKPAK